MKMLVGFLPATEACAALRAADGIERHAVRRNVGYMTQAFSLYGELTVRQNLELHAQLYHLPREKIAPRILELLERYDLKTVANAWPTAFRSASNNGWTGRCRPARAGHPYPRRADLGSRSDCARRVLAHDHRPSRDDGVTIFLPDPFHERGRTMYPSR